MMNDTDINDLEWSYLGMKADMYAAASARYPYVFPNMQTQKYKPCKQIFVTKIKSAHT